MVSTQRVLVALATPAAILGAGALVWHASYASFSGTTRSSGNNWSTGQVALSDDDAGSARFQVANMVPGQTDTKCIKVTANATVPGTVKGYALNPVTSAQKLEDRVLITVEDGTGGDFASCTGFVPDGAALVTDMKLSTLAAFNTYANGMGGWAISPGTQTRTYRVTWKFDTTGMTQGALDALQGAQTGIDIQWELQSS
jgi:hypothetical protein